MAQKNYYIILEVKNTATFEEIKSAYRLLAKKYHPDKNIGNKAAEEFFKEVQEAYAVLSNPEKRKKYDYKLSYGSRPQPQQRTNTNGPQYTGNAYQYAQQQAQFKQQQAYAQPKKYPTKKQESSSWQILVSVGIALVLLYFIISYSTEKTTPVRSDADLVKEYTAVIQEATDKLKDNAAAEDAEAEEVVLYNYYSPYSGFFGEEEFEQTSKNAITFLNGSTSEAVICLIDKSTGKTVRNMYVNREDQIKMSQLADGSYMVKIYFGSTWDPKKSFANGTVKGGFKNDNVFQVLYDQKDEIVMKKNKTGELDSYSTYEIKISPGDKKNAKTISAEAFFTKN